MARLTSRAQVAAVKWQPWLWQLGTTAAILSSTQVMAVWGSTNLLCVNCHSQASCVCLFSCWCPFVLTNLKTTSPINGEGNGTPLQYSCLENPMDGGAWWAAVYGVAQSRTQLKRLSSSRRRQWHPTPVLLSGKSHGWRSLEGCNPWGR